MANKPKSKEEKAIQVHFTVPPDVWERMKAHKDKKYNGLPAMSMMIRDFVIEGIERDEVIENKRG